jgi:C-terminal region of band_7
MAVAEQYISAFSNLAKTNNTVLLPTNTGDISSMVTQASNSLFIANCKRLQAFVAQCRTQVVRDKCGCLSSWEGRSFLSGVPAVTLLLNASI